MQDLMLVAAVTLANFTLHLAAPYTDESSFADSTLWYINGQQLPAPGWGSRATACLP